VVTAIETHQALLGGAPRFGSAGYDLDVTDDAAGFTLISDRPTRKSRDVAYHHRSRNCSGIAPQVRRLRIAAIQPSSALMSPLSSGGSGTGARAAAA
jgi:hypothetical protein